MKAKWQKVDSDTYRLSGTNDDCMVLAISTGAWQVTVDRIWAHGYVRFRKEYNALAAAKVCAEQVWAFITEAAK